MRERFPSVTRCTIRRLRVQRMLDMHVRADRVFRELVPDLPFKPVMHIWRILRMLDIWLGAPRDERTAPPSTRTAREFPSHR